MSFLIVILFVAGSIGLIVVACNVKDDYPSEQDWEKAINFTPWQAEVIIYDADTEHPQARIKIGDGITPVNDLPFIGEKMIWENF